MLKNRAIAMSSDANFQAVPKSVNYRGRAHRTKLKSFRPTDETQRKIDAAKRRRKKGTADWRD